MLSHPNLEKNHLCFYFLEIWLPAFGHKWKMTLTSLAQNVAAGLLAGFNIEHHIAPILASLQWLPVCFRIDFKILMITSVDIAPSYIVQMLAPYKP